MMRVRTIVGSASLAFVLAIPAFAKCPISDGATLVVKAPVGDLQVDTSGRDAAEVVIENNALQLQENCGKDVVEFSAVGQVRGTTIWRIVTPRNVHLDLATMGGNINVADVDGNVILRTAGGSVTVGNIKGKAAIITQGGSIKSGSIGGDAELRSQGGTLEVADIGGNAELHATAGVIRVGNVTGYINAEGGRTISIVKAGEVKATTNAGDISIGDAARINAKSGGGNIISRKVRGPFQGRTEAGDIEVRSAGAWVEAETRLGNIMVRMVPENMDGDLHMNLEAGSGDVTIYVPQKLRASIEAIVQRPSFQGPQIYSEFPVIPDRPSQTLIPNRFYSGARQEYLLNGGSNKIVLHTALGKITIRKN